MPPLCIAGCGADLFASHAFAHDIPVERNGADVRQAPRPRPPGVGPRAAEDHTTSNIRAATGDYVDLAKVDPSLRDAAT